MCESEIITISQPRDVDELIKQGFIPEFSSKSSDFVAFGTYIMKPENVKKMLFEVEYIMTDVTKDEITFWFRGRNLPQSKFRLYNLETHQNWIIPNMKAMLQRGEEYCDSSYLLLHAKDKVYSVSKRPKTQMLTFKTSNSLLVEKSQLIDGKYGDWNVIPVTRYGKGMSKGMYFLTKINKTYNGTFYYKEPESDIYLAYNKALTARNKYTAFCLLAKELKTDPEKLYHKLNPKYSPELDMFRYGELDVFLQGQGLHEELDELCLHYFKNTPDNAFPDDLMLSPAELVKLIPQMLENDGYDIELAKTLHTKRYAGIFLGLYACEDFLDQNLCTIAKELGYDIIILEQMVGSHQVVSEVLDVRDRNISFDHLIYTS